MGPGHWHWPRQPIVAYPWWCQHRISINRGGRERQGGGGGLHHFATAGGRRAGCSLLPNTAGALNGDKKISFDVWQQEMLIEKKKKRLCDWLSWSLTNPLWGYEMRVTRFFRCCIWMWDRQKCSGFWVVEQNRGIIEHSFHVMRSAQQQPTLGSPRLHFSGKSIPPQPLIFVSGQLKQVIISISPELTLIPRGFFFLSVSCHQVQFTSKTRVKPCTLALQEQREHGKAQLNTTTLFPGIGLNLYARFKNPNQYLYEEKKIGAKI